MKINEVLTSLDNLGARGMDFGLVRTENILLKLGSPDKKLKIIHISGTNGKGSVAEFVTQILLAAGKSVGTFTSPEVYDYFGQFRVNGENITKELFARAFGQALECADGATRFEVETAGALNAFRIAGCEYAVVECGLGGTYDATNAISAKEIALVCSISLEHTAILGNDLISIAKHKAGIIKNCPAIVSAYNTAEVLEYFKGLNAVVADKLKITGNGSFIYDDSQYVLTAKGCEQPYNASLAIECAKRLNIAESAIYEGVKRTNPQGRLEFIRTNSNVYILDGAHNPSAFAPLAQILEETGGADCVILGSLSDKNIDGNILRLKGLAGRIIAVAPNSPRAMDTGKITAVCVKYGIPVKTAGSVEKALKEADGTVAVCGTFTILKEAKAWIEKRL